MTDKQPDLLTITEAAAIVRRHVAPLRHWRHLRTGPAASDSVGESSTGRPPCRSGLTANRGDSEYRYM
jgi:hypothetical protein